MTRFISYLVDFSLSTFIFASNLTDCLITFEKKKRVLFFRKFSTKHEKDFSPLVCSHRSKMSSGGIEEISKRLILIDQRSIHDLFSVDKDSVILTSHIQGVQKYGIKFFNTKLTYFQKEIINNYFCNVKMNISRRLIKRSNFILLSSNYFNHLIIR